MFHVQQYCGSWVVGGGTGSLVSQFKSALPQGCRWRPSPLFPCWPIIVKSKNISRSATPRAAALIYALAFRTCTDASYLPHPFIQVHRNYYSTRTRESRGVRPGAAISSLRQAPSDLQGVTITPVPCATPGVFRITMPCPAYLGAISRNRPWQRWGAWPVWACTGRI
jgi:hypothetical protein